MVEFIAAKDNAAATTNPYLKVALVDKTEEVKELALLYAKDSPWETRVFKDLEDARIWIDEHSKKFSNNALAHVHRRI